MMNLFKACVLAVLIIAIVIGAQAIFYCLPKGWKWVVMVILFTWVVYSIRGDMKEQ